MTETPEIVFHGAARTVTGSCMELRVGKRRLLVDCGLFQGSRTLEALNAEGFAFDAARLDAVILTHAHIDHSGLLPRLVREGSAGPIWCTGPTRDLLDHMLPDAGRIQESDVERRNRRADRADEPEVEPIYTEADAKQAAALARPVALERWFEPVPGVRARLWNAGHILGSASVEIEAGGSRLLFSGDIGPEHKAFHPDPEAPQGFDHVVCESTYGDRTREHTTIPERRTLLEAEIKAALTRGGNLVIPVFALERTQELLLDVAMLINTGRLPYTQVFIDSPLASRTTGVFARHAADLEDMGSGEVFRHPAFHYVGSASQSMKLNSVSGAIIMAASGMCESGRIRHHLRHNLGRRESTVLFVGFQAAGTLGRTIMDGAPRVRISGHDVAVRAQVRRIDSYSAHADQADILRWINERRPIAGSIFLTHGEADAMESLRRLLQRDDAAASIVTPELGERYALPPRAKARRLSAGRTDMEAAVGRDWQNAYADFAVNLKRELSDIENAAARREAIERMRAVLQSYKASRMNRKIEAQSARGDRK
ncbi:MBL fold metallo-hydrolase [Sphingosinicella microcystinivorans]|uniref:MBL fold metallo-hydrolase n=1 Tax=Sphingosinicella microcystinivorans TaxID=335406 RepID=UPI0022F3B89E|nr:MBL fold metallo-hydrolase [Sphingosinicella microcystinivorans]WBX83071.1 MBL fold metallo-hydrolase [Sphingosinicella microcystinivorans]